MYFVFYVAISGGVKRFVGVRLNTNELISTVSRTKRATKLRYIPIWTYLLWRRRWDSNPRALSDYRISSAARYDHFDTPPRNLSEYIRVNEQYLFYHIFIRLSRIFLKNKKKIKICCMNG